MDLCFTAFNVQQHTPLYSRKTKVSCFSVTVPVLGHVQLTLIHIILKSDTDIDAFINNASIYSYFTKLCLLEIVHVWGGENHSLLIIKFQEYGSIFTKMEKKPQSKTIHISNQFKFYHHKCLLETL